MITFDRVLPELIRICQEDVASQQAIDRIASFATFAGGSD
jgi:hypothetical protein